MSMSLVLAVLLEAALDANRELRLAGPARLASVHASCPLVERIGGWIEEVGAPPAAVIEARPGLPLGSAAPNLLPIQGIYYWVGLAHRSNPLPDGSDNPGCFAAGSAAFYAVGPEQDPEIDFVKSVEDNEQALAARLVELRWFDPADGLRHRWFNVPLAKKLGWLTGPRGETDEGHRPIPLPAAANSIY